MPSRRRLNQRLPDFTLQTIVSSPPNIQRFPNAIHAQESALRKGRLPHAPGSIASSIPAGRENIQHHLGHGLRPVAKAFICVAERTRKNIQYNISAGNRKTSHISAQAPPQSRASQGTPARRQAHGQELLYAQQIKRMRDANVIELRHRRFLL